MRERVEVGWERGSQRRYRTREGKLTGFVSDYPGLLTVVPPQRDNQSEIEVDQFSSVVLNRMTFVFRNIQYFFFMILR